MYIAKAAFKSVPKLEEVKSALEVEEEIASGIVGEMSDVEWTGRGDTVAEVNPSVA
jgi:hypothetical protein